jgi:APA family basic amino acid/polyamine antiporter
VLLVAANYTRGLTELFAFMALLATVATLVLYLFATISAFRLMARGELSKGLLLVTLIGAVYALWTFYGAGKEATLWGLLLLMTAIPVWFGMRLSSLWSTPVPAVVPAAPPESSS